MMMKPYLLCFGGIECYKPFLTYTRIVKLLELDQSGDQVPGSDRLNL